MFVKTSVSTCLYTVSSADIWMNPNDSNKDYFFVRTPL